MPSPREEKMRESWRDGLARSIYETWAEIEGSFVTWPQLVEYAGKDGYPNAHKFHDMALREADACLTYLIERQAFHYDAYRELKEERLGNGK